MTENEYVASQMVQTNFVNSASQHILKRYSIDDSFRYNVDRLLATFSTDRLLYFGNPLYRFYLIDEYCLVRPWLAVGEIQKLYVRPKITSRWSTLYGKSKGFRSLQSRQQHV